MSIEIANDLVYDENINGLSHEITHHALNKGAIPGYAETMQSELEHHCIKTSKVFYAISSSDEALEIFEGQPAENITVPVGRQIATNPSEMPKEFQGPDIATKNVKEELREGMQQAILEHPELSKAFHEDGKLERKEIAHLLPTEGDTAGKIFLAGDHVAERLLDEGFLENMDLSGSEIIGISVIGKDLRNVKTDGLKIQSSIIANCDLRGKDLYKIETNNSEMTWNKISDNSANRQFTEQNKDSVSLSNWHKSPKSASDLSGALPKSSDAEAATLSTSTATPIADTTKKLNKLDV
jgi:uncharacterized protein YjbI with pentapeptide repeats